MIFYGMIIIITTLFSYLYSHSKGSSKKIYWFLLIVFPSFFSAMRGVGTDYVQHGINFEKIISGNFYLVNYRSILIKLMKILGNWGVDYQIVIGIVSFLTIYLTFTIFRIYQEDISFTYATFSYMTMYYLLTFNLYRQFMAAELFLLAIIYKAKFKKDRKFWLFGILAGMIHSSVFLFLPIYFIWNVIVKEKYKKVRCFIYFTCLLSIILLPSIANKLVILGELFPHYKFYFSEFTRFRVGFGLVRYLILAIWPVIYLKKEQIIKMEYSLFFLVFGTILWLTSYISQRYIYRLAFNLLIVLPLVHGLLYKNCIQLKKQRCMIKLRGVGIIFVTAVLLVFWYYDFKVKNSGLVVPYHFFGNIAKLC